MGSRRAARGADEGLEPRRLVGKLATDGSRERDERLEPHAARPEAPDARHETVDEERWPDLAALDDQGSVLVRDHAPAVVVAQDEVVEPREEPCGRRSVASGERRAGQVVQLASVLV